MHRCSNTDRESLTYSKLPQEPTNGVIMLIELAASFASAATRPSWPDPTSIIVMRHTGSDTDCLTSTIEGAAGLAVMETQSSPPRFVPFKAYPDDENTGVNSVCRSSVDAFKPAKGIREPKMPINAPCGVTQSSSIAT